MPSIPIVGELFEVIKTMPSALKEIPEQQRDARAQILSAVTDLSEAVSQALNVVTAKCGRIILKRDDFPQFCNELVTAPNLLDEFRLNNVCFTLGKVRAELRTILDMKTFSLRLFYRKRLEHLLEQLQRTERDLEEQFDLFLRELSIRGAELRPEETGEIIQYLRDCQEVFETDRKILRSAMREVEESL